MIQEIFDLFSKETQYPFSDSFGFKNPILDFLKETHPRTVTLNYREIITAFYSLYSLFVSSF